MFFSVKDEKKKFKLRFVIFTLRFLGREYLAGKVIILIAVLVSIF